MPTSGFIGCWLARHYMGQNADINGSLLVTGSHSWGVVGRGQLKIDPICGSGLEEGGAWDALQSSDAKCH